MKTIRQKRGKDSVLKNHIGSEGELIYNQDTKRIHSQDGTTLGGNPHALLSDIPFPLNLPTEGFVKNNEIPKEVDFFYLSGKDFINDGMGGLFAEGGNNTPNTITSKEGRKWYRIEGSVNSSINVSVGSSGNFRNINEALTYLQNMKPLYIKNGLKFTITLQSGYIWNEQILVGSGMDLSHIKIVSLDTEVIINTNSIVEYLSEEDGLRPVIGAKDGGKAPVLGCLLSYPDSSMALDGVAAIYSGIIEIAPECGIKNARQAVVAMNNGQVNCFPKGLRSGPVLEMGAIFTGAHTRALHANHSGIINLPRSNFDDCKCSGDIGEAVMVIWGSYANLYQSSIQRSAKTAILARDGGRVIARESNVANAGQHGYQAYHGGYIDARYLPTSPAGDGGCSGCPGYGVAADTGSIVEAAGMNARNCGTAFYASDGGIIVALDANATGSNRGILCKGGGVVAANNAIMNDCGLRAVDAECGTVSFQNGEANNNKGDIAVRSDASANVDCRGATVNNAANSALYAYEGGRIAADGVIAQNAGTYGAMASRGGHITIMNGDVSGAGTFGVHVANGGTIAARTLTGTAGVTKNELTINGYILG